MLPIVFYIKLVEPWLTKCVPRPLTSTIHASIDMF